MGASGWEHRVPYAGSVQASLEAAQREILASGEYLWPWEGYDPDYLDGLPLPRPQSLDELSAAKRDEVFWEAGTHTLLDVERVAEPADSNDFAAVRPLREEELLAAFGTQQPTPPDFERVREPGPGACWAP